MYGQVLLMLVLFQMLIAAKKEADEEQKFAAKCPQENRKSFVDTLLLSNFLSCQFQVADYSSELSPAFPVRTDHFLSSVSFQKVIL